MAHVRLHGEEFTFLIRDVRTVDGVLHPPSLEQQEQLAFPKMTSEYFHSDMQGCVDNCAASTYLLLYSVKCNRHCLNNFGRNSREILLKLKVKRKAATVFALRHQTSACKTSLTGRLRKNKIYLNRRIYVV